MSTIPSVDKTAVDHMMRNALEAERKALRAVAGGASCSSAQGELEDDFLLIGVEPGISHVRHLLQTGISREESTAELIRLRLEGEWSEFRLKTMIYPKSRALRANQSARPAATLERPVPLIVRAS